MSPPRHYPKPGGRLKEPHMTSRMPVDDKVLAADTQTTTPTLYQRVLIAVADASQVGPVVELARRAGVREARVLHLNLRESYGAGASRSRPTPRPPTPPGQPSS